MRNESGRLWTSVERGFSNKVLFSEFRNSSPLVRHFRNSRWKPSGTITSVIESNASHFHRSMLTGFSWNSSEFHHEIIHCHFLNKVLFSKRWDLIRFDGRNIGRNSMAFPSAETLRGRQLDVSCKSTSVAKPDP